MFLLYIDKAIIVLSSIILSLREREHCGVGCVAEDCQGDSFDPFTNKLCGRSFYLSSP